MKVPEKSEVDWKRRQLLRQWKDVLTEDEWRAIHSSNTTSQLREATRLSEASRRIRFHVAEWLQGPGLSEIDIYTDFTSCGYRFKPGVDYLVVSYEDQINGRWWTGACSHSQPVASAQEDLNLLRAWKKGTPISRRVYGQTRIIPVENGPFLIGSNVQLQLSRNEVILESRSGKDGNFSFDDLAPARYILTPIGTGLWGTPAVLDLNDRFCAEVDVDFSTVSYGQSYSFFFRGGGILSAPDSAPFPDPPQLTLPPNPKPPTP